MASLDVFKSSAFSMFSMTEALNIVPKKWTRLRELGIFTEEPLMLRTFAVEQTIGVLNLIQSKPVGAPAAQNTIGHRSLRNFTIPHFPLEDSVLAQDVVGVRAFGTESELMGVQELLAEKLQTMADKHEQQREYLEWGALRGIVLEADTTTIVNYFTEFGITQQTFNFAFSSATTNPAIQIMALKDWLEKSLEGEIMNGVQVFCSAPFFDALITHVLVKEAYANWSSRQPLGMDYRSKFEHNGVVFERHIGAATDAAGNIRDFVPANEAIAIATGTTNTFRTVFAPANFMETANTRALPRYAKQERLEYDRGIKIWTESNLLPICKRPKLIVKLTKS